MVRGMVCIVYRRRGLSPAVVMWGDVMLEQGDSTGERLTRGYEPTRDVGGDTDPDWAMFRARLFAELAPRSLTDRLLAEGIESIAERAFYAGQEIGLHLGSATTGDDTLAWVAQIRAQHHERAAHAALAALEALLLRARAHNAATVPDAARAARR